MKCLVKEDEKIQILDLVQITILNLKANYKNKRNKFQKKFIKIFAVLSGKYSEKVGKAIRKAL